jgi:beta-lactam-binding protein with PASTA domain
MYQTFFRYLLLLAISAIIFQQTQAQERIEIPKLVELDLEEAWSILNENGLTMVVTPELNTRYRPGTVFEQDPPPGETLSPGSSVKLKVATAIAEVEVPDLMKSSLDEARTLLQNKQLSILTELKRTIKYEHGTVFEQHPPAGTKVPLGTPVRLSVADVPQMVEVPVLVGRPLGEVRAILDELDLSMGAAPELAADHSPGTVFEQNPPPGTRVPITTPVYLAVATASDLVEIPNLVGRMFEEAWRMLQDAQLAAVADPAISAEHTPGSVFAQSVTAGSKVPIGTPVTLRIATVAEKVTVSNFRGESFEETQAVLRNAGLPMAITAEVNSEFAPGTIMEQSLTAGSLAAIGTPVYIKVATAPNMVAIPNLNGQPLAVAQAMLQENGLPMAVEIEKSAGYAPGTIFAQNPSSGNEIHVGTPVGVKVALGPENVTVPNLSNRSLEEAGAILQESKLSMVVKTENTAGHPPGTVIEQNISDGSRVSIGSPVYLKVATDSALVNIGSLEGRSLEEVQAILQNHRLPMIVMPQTNFDYKPGIVFEQISAPGKTVSPGVPLYVKVALDTKIVEIPSCDSLNVEEAYQTLRELHLPMVTKPQLTTANRPGVVVKQNPPSGSRVPAGTPVYFEVAVGSDSVTVPGLANRPFEDAWAVSRNIRLPLVLLEEKTGEHRPGIIFE